MPAYHFSRRARNLDMLPLLAIQSAALPRHGRRIERNRAISSGGLERAAHQVLPAGAYACALLLFSGL